MEPFFPVGRVPTAPQMWLAVLVTPSVRPDPSPMPRTSCSVPSAFRTLSFVLCLLSFASYLGPGPPGVTHPAIPLPEPRVCILIDVGTTMTDPPHSDRPWSQESKELRLYCRSVCTDVFGPGPTVDRNAPAARARVSPSTRVGTSGRQAPKNPADTSEGPVEPFFPVGRVPPAPQVLQMVLSAPGVRALRCHRPHRLLPLASCLLPLASCLLPLRVSTPIANATAHANPNVNGNRNRNAKRAHA